MVGLNLNKGFTPNGINAERLNSLNIELVGENKFQSSDPDATDCRGIYAGSGFPVHIYGAGSLEISGCGFNRHSIDVQGDLTLGKAGNERTSLTVTGMDSVDGFNAIQCRNSLEIVNADVTIVDADFSGMFANEDITITDSTIKISDSYASGIFSYGDINILGDTELELINAGSAAIVADEGGKIKLDKGLAILSPENGEIVSFSYEDDGMVNAQTIALPDAVIEYDEDDYLFTGAAQSVKIGKGEPEPEPSFLEQLFGFLKKLVALINYLNTGKVILPSEF